MTRKNKTDDWSKTDNFLSSTLTTVTIVLIPLLLLPTCGNGDLTVGLESLAKETISLVNRGETLDKYAIWDEVFQYIY